MKNKKLNKKEQKIYDAIIQSFPATDPESAYDIAIQGGVNWNYNYR